MKDDLKRLRADQRWDGIYLVIAFGLLLGLVSFGFATLGPIHWVWLVPFMGWVQYYIVISGHEAVHRTLCPKVWLNESIGVVGQAMIGVNFTAYRLQHIDHHSAPTYESDPDAHIYMGVMRQQPGLKRFVWLTAGTFIEIIIKIRQKGVEGYGTKRNIKPEMQGEMRRDSLLVIVCQLCWMWLAWWLLDLHTFWPEGVLLSWSNLGWIGTAIKTGVELIASYAVFWTIPLFCITVFLNRCRIVIEHGLALAIVDGQLEFNGSRIPTVEVRPSKLEQWIFSPFMFNYHSSHHTYMTVPFYHLPTLNRLMNERFSSPENSVGYLEYSNGYLQALWTVVNHPYIAPVHKV